VSLPFEEKIRRERLASRLKIKPEESATNYKRHEDPYQLYSFPYVDMSLNSEFNKGSSQGFSNNYSLLAKGDIGYMTGEVFLAGDLTNDRLQIARLNMRRTDENRMLLGWLNAIACHLSHPRQAGAVCCSPTVHFTGLISLT
jgi:hypothetical protein